MIPIDPEKAHERASRAARSVWIAPSVVLLLAGTGRAAPQGSVRIEQRAYFEMGQAADGAPAPVPSIDASGITFHAPSGHLFIVDSEIDETPDAWNDVRANVFEVSRDGQVLYARFDLGHDEPTGITYNAFDDHFYVTDDDDALVYRYSYDGSGFTEVDSASTLPDSADPEGVASDPSTGTIYVLDGKLRRVLVFTYQGGFVHDSTIALGDCPNGSVDVEGIVFDPQSEHLLVVSPEDLAVHDVDLGGNCLAELDVSALSPRPVAPQGLALGPPNADEASSALFIADGGIDNDQDPDERDAAAYEGEIVPAPPGEAFHFNGIGDYLQVPHASDLYPGTLTVSAWIRPSLLGPDDYVLSTKEGGGYSLGIEIHGGSGGVLSSRSRVGGVYRDVYGATPLAVDTWAHVAMTYDGAAFRLFVNGVEDGFLAAPGTLDPSAGDLFIGAESNGGVPASLTRFAGRIDEVVLWNAALTPGEVAASCTPDGSALPAPGNVVARWRFEQLTAGVTPDETGLHDAAVHGADHVAPGPGGASVAFRNVPPNPASYTASDPVLGSTWTAEVDLTTTGHAFAQVVGFLSPANVDLRRGQVLLVGGAKLFQLPPKPGPVACWSVPVPDDCALLGFLVYTQAVHFLGVKPFALSNARDLILGY